MKTLAFEFFFSVKIQSDNVGERIVIQILGKVCVCGGVSNKKFQFQVFIRFYKKEENIAGPKVIGISSAA